MKKLLTVSIMAVMAVTAANAEIASKAYVDQRETAAVNSAKGYTDTKIGNIDGADVAAAIAKAVTGGTENVVTHTGAVGNATTPVYITEQGVATAGTALGTMATENAADYSKTGADTTYAKASDFTTLQSAVNNESTGLAATKAIADANKSAIENATTGLTATKAIADAADTLSKANKATLDGLDTEYVKETELTTTLSEYTKTGADTTYAKASDFTTLQSAVNNESTGLAATKAIADANKTAIGDANSGLTKGVADNAAAIAALGDTYATDAELTAGLGTKQNTLTEAQLAAANSGITEAKVSTYDGYAATIAGKQDKLGATNVSTTGTGNAVTAVTAADGSVTVTLGSSFIEQTAAITTNGKYALTANVTDGAVSGYGWELIQRAE